MQIFGLCCELRVTANDAKIIVRSIIKYKTIRCSVLFTWGVVILFDDMNMSNNQIKGQTIFK